MSATTRITTNGVFSIIYGVSDLPAAKAAFTALLGTPPHDSAYYVGWQSGDLQIGLARVSDGSLIGLTSR